MLSFQNSPHINLHTIIPIALHPERKAALLSTCNTLAGNQLRTFSLSAFCLSIYLYILSC